MNLEELKAIREKAQKDIQLRQKKGGLRSSWAWGQAG